MQIAYIAHNINDPAIRRRVRMLQAGGASVLVAGFCRGDLVAQDIDGAPIVCNLGETFDGRAWHRAASVMRAIATTPRIWKSFEGTDVVLARNLEALAVGFVLQRRLPNSRLIYEVLDIHKLLLGRGLVSRTLRSIERRLMRAVKLVLVSSPAFISEYYTPKQSWTGHSLLVENKVFDDRLPARRLDSNQERSPPWKIGWFGVIRCSKSLDLLGELVRRSHGRVQVHIRGQVARQEFNNFDDLVSRTAGIDYFGPYDYAELADLYRQTDFTWAIDYFEEGLNSSWLLPNRLYEGGLMGGPVIALKTVETGRWLARQGVGVLVDDPIPELTEFFSSLGSKAYQQMQERVQKIDLSKLQAGVIDCVRLIESL